MNSWLWMAAQSWSYRPWLWMHSCGEAGTQSQGCKTVNYLARKIKHMWNRQVTVHGLDFGIHAEMMWFWVIMRRDFEQVDNCWHSSQNKNCWHPNRCLILHLSKRIIKFLHLWPLDCRCPFYEKNHPIGKHEYTLRRKAEIVGPGAWQASPEALQHPHGAVVSPSNSFCWHRFSRRSGWDCRNLFAMEGRPDLPPCVLDTGNPCRYDGCVSSIWVNAYPIMCFQIQRFHL